MAEYKLPYTAKQIEDRLEYVGNMMDSGGNVDYVGIEPAYDDIPKIFFGGALQQTKTEAVVPFRYISKTDDFSGYAEIKAQGNSSMSYPKKNQTVKMFKDEACASKMKVDFKGWGKQNKHVYKANWIDLTQARNVVSARLWADVVKSRANYADLPELLRTSPNQGAVDGFPVKVYAAGVYQGRYTLNIPKDKWTFNMDDELDEHCVLCGENYISGCFRAAANINGSDWSDEIHDVVPASIKTRWNQVISFVMNSTDEEFRANLSQYFYVDSLIDYYLFGLASCGLDAFGKNQIYATYDGQRWIASMYDMDSTWGLYWNGSRFVATDYARTSFEDMVNGRQGNLLYMRLEQLFWSELQTRWAELKNGALSIENIINRFERFTDIAPVELVKEDYASTTGGGKFTGIPSKDTNNIQQIRSFALARQAWTDTYVTGLTPEVQIPCAGISLDKNTLTFSDEGTQTVTATVTPADTTDKIVWSSDNESVATVENGIVSVHAISGTATITAMCGGYSASCLVTVDIPDESVLYSLSEATTFDGTNYIDTGVQLFAEDKPFTLTLDWKHTGESQFVSNTHVIAHCMREVSPWPGLVLQYSLNNMHFEMNQTQSAKLNPAASIIEEGGSVRAVFVKDSNGVITVSARYNNAGNIAKVTKQGTFVALTENLLLGCYQDSSGNKGRYAKGILNDCKVYNRALSDEEINAYLLDDSIGEPDEPVTPDGSDIDYTLDALSGATWLEGYAVNDTTGEVGAKANHYVTEPITLQDCMYQFDNGSGNAYPGIAIYDVDDNFVGHIETTGDTNFGKFYGNSIYKYRVQVYSTTASHKNAKIIPVNNSTGAKYTALDLSTASWRLAKDAAVTTLTTEQKDCIVGSDQCSVFILANTDNQSYVNVKNVLAPDVFYMSSFGDSYYLHAPYFKTVDDATEYFANYTIEFNKRYQVEPDVPEEPEVPDIPDGSDIDYTADALTYATWQEGYNINKTNGEVVAKANHYTTEMITLQDCMYQLNGGSGNTYVSVIIYDADGNYLGFIENGSYKIYGNPKYKYRIQLYSTTASYKNATLIPIDNSAGAEYTVIDLENVTWELSNGCAETIITAEQYNRITRSDQCNVFVAFNISGANWKKALSPEMFSVSVWNDNYYLHAPYFTTADSASEYFAQNNAVLEFNKRYQVEPDEPVPCEGITLNKTSLTFSGEGTQILTATVEPSDTTDVISWISDNESVVTVENGIVTAVSNGSATITAICGECSASCAVSVSGIEIYTTLEYIESSGTQYIDTGISGNTNAAWEIQMNSLATAATMWEQYFAGSKPSTVPNLGDITPNTYLDGIGSSCVSGTSNVLCPREDAVHIFRYDGTNAVYVDGTAKTPLANDPTGNGWGDLTWYVFNSHAEPNLKSSMRLYYLKMWTDGVLVRDFIPVKRKADNVLCLFDKVTNTFFENIGTGAFTGT